MSQHTTNKVEHTPPSSSLILSVRMHDHSTTNSYALTQCGFFVVLVVVIVLSDFSTCSSLRPPITPQEMVGIVTRTLTSDSNSLTHQPAAAIRTSTTPATALRVPATPTRYVKPTFTPPPPACARGSSTSITATTSTA